MDIKLSLVIQRLISPIAFSCCTPENNRVMLSRLRLSRGWCFLGQVTFSSAPASLCHWEAVVKHTWKHLSWLSNYKGLFCLWWFKTVCICVYITRNITDSTPIPFVSAAWGMLLLCRTPLKKYIILSSMLPGKQSGSATISQILQKLYVRYSMQRSKNQKYCIVMKELF